MTHLTSPWLLCVLSFLRQVSDGCRLFTSCSHFQAITCNVREPNGNTSQVMSASFCQRDVIFDNVEIFSTSESLNEYKLSNTSLDGLQSRQLTIRLRISLIESDAFQGLAPVLEVLDISENKLDSFPRGLFRRLNKVRRLNLSFNKFTNVPAEALRPLVGLRDLVLANNEIRYIGGSDLIGLQNLNSLDLSFNKIARIDSEAFRPLINLQKLSLHNNKYVCNCDLAWMRHYQSCVCALIYDKCTSPPSMSPYTVTKYPVNGHSCGPALQDVTIHSPYENCSNEACKYESEFSGSYESHTEFKDRPLETPSEEVDESSESGQGGTNFSPTDDNFITAVRNSYKNEKSTKNTFTEGAIKPGQVDSICCPLEITITNSKANSGQQKTNNDASTYSPTTWTHRQTPRAVKRASEGWMAALLIGGLFLFIVLIIGAIHFAQKVRRYCPLAQSRQALATIDTGQVMYASSVLMDDTDERTAISDVTDM